MDKQGPSLPLQPGGRLQDPPPPPPSFSYLQTHLQLTFLARCTGSLPSAPHAVAATLVGPTTASLRPALHRLSPRHHLKYPRTRHPLLKTFPRLPPHSGTHSPWGLATPSLSLPALPLEPPLQPRSDREAQLPATCAQCRPASLSACPRATAVTWCPGEWLRAGSRAPAPRRRPRRDLPWGPGWVGARACRRPWEEARPMVPLRPGPCRARTCSSIPTPGGGTGHLRPVPTSGPIPYRPLRAELPPL